MAGMFPTMVADPNDRNRRHTDAAGETWPTPLKVAYWLVVAAAVLMLVTAVDLFATVFLGFLGTYLPPDLDTDVTKSLLLNTRIVAVGNIVLALGLAACAAFFERGSKRARRFASVLVMLAVFINLAGFFVHAVGFAAFVIVILLAFAGFFMFRPAANAFVDHRSGDLWEGLR
ncbi:hypothetical protein HMPREF3101_06510 [Corynebacterium sp. HMSC29G08]|nr:hypothetical protein HMPREF3101_06510 [Corynebacterium sp. HMSC29G08]